MTLSTFKSLVSKKVKSLSKNKYYSIPNLDILNNSRERLEVDHVIFGEKYIYLISDFMLKGLISGEANDNSWIYFDSIKRTNNYLSNLTVISDRNRQEFADILGISPDPIISICLVPNECDFKINGLDESKNPIIHYTSLSRSIRALEEADIGSLNKEQIYEQFKTIERRNEETRRK